MRPALNADEQKFKGYRPTRAKEHTPTVPEGRPTCPKYLSAEARQRFRQLCRELETRRALSKGDGELLALYSTTWERWRKAMADVAVRGEVVISVSRGKNGEAIEREKKNPWLLIAQESEKSMVGILDRLGMSPLNRERVKPVKKDESKAPLPEGSVGAALIEFRKQQRQEEQDAARNTEGDEGRTD